MECVRIPPPLVISESSCQHEHPLKLSHGEPSDSLEYNCAVCGSIIRDKDKYYYRCHQCKFAIHLRCVHYPPEAYHSTSHPEHPLKSISSLPDYAHDIKCLLCGGVDSDAWNKRYKKPHHCDHMRRLYEESHCMFPALWEPSHTSSMVQSVMYPTPPFVDHFAFGVLLDACSLPFLRFPCPKVLYTFVLKNV
ncbi:unnamed protein product [Brassica oleracea]|uniref:Phorbol-ester/DAG-type domain-containing protein n=1 Tax=Brassica oleracea TaxID=3712 RepID=A0A3P6CBL1_BRAOL|nr:unnamed protein product [Brassica oleracea]